MDYNLQYILLGGFMILVLFSAIISYFVYAYLLSRIFAKAGVERWKAWVPIYNNWILMELGGQRGFWAIVIMIPIVQIVGMIYLYIAMYHIGLKLGKKGDFILWGIFLQIVWLIWLAFDDSKWREKKRT